MINHPELQRFKTPGGLFDVEPCAMDLNIGRRGRMINYDIQIDGTMARDFPFLVIGVQKDYLGNKCYRIVFECPLDSQGFGRPVDPEKVRWIN